MSIKILETIGRECIVKCDCSLGTEFKVHKSRVEGLKCCGRKGCIFRRKDISNKRFGRLTALNVDRLSDDGTYIWKCLCDCGNTVFVKIAQLNNGNTKSCGCYNRDQVNKAITKHGKSHSKSYSVYTDIIQRCYNSKSKAYKNYGAFNVSVCKEWREDPEKFCNWYEAEYSKISLEILKSNRIEVDRIDPYGNYSPDNCRLVTRFENQQNRKNSLKVVFENTLQPVRILYERFKHLTEHPYYVIHGRVKNGWEFMEAMTIPIYGKR